MELTGQFQCEFCSLQFNSSEALLLHLSEHENNDDGKWWVLIFRHTKLILYLRYLLSEFIFDQDYEFMNECNICSRDFSTTEGLLLHLAEHGICDDSEYLF